MGYSRRAMRTSSNTPLGWGRSRSKPKIKIDKNASLHTKARADFDREFVATMMSDETDAIILFTNQRRKTTDAALQAFAYETLPTLRGHMNIARKLRAKVF